MFLLQQIVAERSRPSYKNNLTCGNSSRISLNSSCFRNTNCTPTTKKKRSFLPKTSSSCTNTNGTNDLPFLYLVNLRIIHVALGLLLFFFLLTVGVRSCTSLCRSSAYASATFLRHCVCHPVHAPRECCHKANLERKKEKNVQHC